MFVVDLPIAENQRSASSKLSVANMTSTRGTAPAGLANPAEEINQDKFSQALQSNWVLIYQSHNTNVLSYQSHK